MSRTIPSRQLLDEIDLPLIVLFASLFVVNGAFSATGLPQSGMSWIAGLDLLPGAGHELDLGMGGRSGEEKRGGDKGAA